MGKILFITGPIGLGHVAREMEIAKELRKLDPSVEIFWSAEEPAASVLRSAGEKIPHSLAEAQNTTGFVERVADDYSVSLCTMFLKWLKTFPDRMALYKKIMKEEGIDTVVGDEAMDVMLTLVKEPGLKDFKFVYLTDFFGAYQVKMNPMELMATRIFNKSWGKFMENPELYEEFIFIGEKEDIGEESLGVLLPNRRDLAYKYAKFVGQILPFRPEDYMDREAMKRKLGYGQGPLIICTGGGSSAGKPLLNLCAKAYPILKKSIPDAQMKIVTGPRISPQEIASGEGVQVMGYVPKLYEHFAAADLVVTSGGGTSTLELTALQRPFLYFPFQDHWEQNHDVVRRCERYAAGVKMTYDKTTPESLSQAIQENLGKKTSYPQVPLEGAAKTAKLVQEVMQTS